jgi:putative phosphoribosyl transferase
MKIDQKNAVRESDVQIAAGNIVITATLAVPDSAEKIVLFAHGSGSGRFSPRNRFVAEFLRESNLATILIDLLTPQEVRFDAVTRELRFNIPLLAERVIAATDWLGDQEATRHLKVGYFGASTGAAAALTAAAQRPDRTAAVVSRGGRPDLAWDDLPKVKAPTLLIVGGDDPEVVRLNRHAMAQMTAPCELTIVEGASHLFEEPGKLEEVARLARDWFLKQEA